MEELQIFVTFLVDTMDAWFKVQLNKKDDTEFGEKVDTKKYKIKTLKATLLSDLKKKIVEGFTELQEPQMTFDLCWKDKDEDCISVENNESLLDAIKEMGGFMYSFYALMYLDTEKGSGGGGTRVISVSDKGTREVSIGGELQNCKINNCIELHVDDKEL